MKKIAVKTSAKHGNVLMIELSDLLDNRKFVQNSLNSVPCALMVFDETGRALAINSAKKRLFGFPSANTDAELPLASSMDCLDSYEKKVKCGEKESCSKCCVRTLALASIEQNKVLKATTQLQIVRNGLVRDTLLSLSAYPFAHKGEKICFLVIENLRSNDYKDSSDTQEGFHGIISHDEKMLEIFDTISQIRLSDDPVLVQGESGTGKELVALAIHRESRRADRHFVPVNCGAMPEGLLESEMFGHVKGAFTGANHDKKGRFKIADRGTIFLDEIGEMNLSMQVKFLRIIETGAYEPVGSDKTVSVNVRVISATNRQIEKEIDGGRFRSDLYYRLCVIPIMIPPLRHRKKDILPLSEYFLKEYARHHDRIRLSNSAKSVLEKYIWPGNVRELQNVLKYAALKCRRGLITPEHFPHYLPWLKINHKQCLFAFYFTWILSFLFNAG